MLLASCYKALNQWQTTQIKLGSLLYNRRRQSFLAFSPEQLYLPWHDCALHFLWKKPSIKSKWHDIHVKKIIKSLAFADKPFLELFWGDQACSEVGIPHTLGLPPRGIILAHDFQHMSSFKRQPSLLARDGSVFFGVIAEKCPHEHL